jgi:CheY-like chemotaxis protein
VVEKAKSTGERAGSGRRRVLVIDDAEGIRTYLATCLELRGYDVDSAEDGARALALLEGGADPDVVLLDVMMPGIDGLQTLERIRELAPAVPVVMLSVVGRTGTIVDAMQRGAWSSPESTSICLRNSSTGFRVRGNSNAAPSAAGVQSFMMMPFGT